MKRRRDTIRCDRFYFLREAEKARILDEEGVLVARYCDHESYFELYQLGNFYVELQVYTHHFITLAYYIFQDGDALDKYLSKIDLSHLFD